MKTLHLDLTSSYSIYIENNLLEKSLLKEYCIKLNKRLIIVTDCNLVNTLGKTLQTELLKRGLEVELLSFPAGEIYKTRETKQMLEDELFSRQCGRDTCLIALGGGVVLDLVGFLAATYCRGVPVIYIPTTLLAMVDASIGGKTGVNTAYGKNLIGTFTQPHAVFIDSNTLRTLPQKEWLNGVVEMIKHSLIADPALFGLLQKNSENIKNRDFDCLNDMIYASCFIKKRIVEQDEKEQGLRQLLNFGHTIGHAIETIENYQISHGEAVAIGMLVESYLSVQYGFLQENIFTMLQDLLHDYGLSLQTSAFQCSQIFQNKLKLDKKSVKNNTHMVLLDGIGKPHLHQNRYTTPISPDQLIPVLNWAAVNFETPHKNF